MKTETLSDPILKSLIFAEHNSPDLNEGTEVFVITVDDEKEKATLTKTKYMATKVNLDPPGCPEPKDGGYVMLITIRKENGNDKLQAKYKNLVTDAGGVPRVVAKTWAEARKIAAFRKFEGLVLLTTGETGEEEIEYYEFVR